MTKDKAMQVQETDHLFSNPDSWRNCRERSAPLGNQPMENKQYPAQTTVEESIAK